MVVNTKILCTIFLSLFIFDFSQNIEIKINTDTISFNKNAVDLEFTIRNTNTYPIFLILDSREVAIYNNINEYVLDTRSVKFERIEDEKIFNPRTIITTNKNDTLRIVPTLNVTPSIEHLDECQQKEKKILEEEKYQIIEFKNKNFPNKDLIWNRRAKYINENLLIIKPFETKKFLTKVNFTALINNPEGCNLYNLGYEFNEKKYFLTLKIHSDYKLVKKYLTKENQELIKQNNWINKRLLFKSHYSQN